MIYLLIVVAFFYLVEEQTLNKEESVEYRMLAKLLLYGGLAVFYYGWFCLLHIGYMDGTPPDEMLYVYPAIFILSLFFGPRILVWVWDKWRDYEERS